MHLLAAIFSNVLTSFALLLNSSFRGRILEKCALFTSVFTDLASCIISFANSFGSLSLDKPFVPTWLIISTSNCSCVGFLWWFISAIFAPEMCLTTMYFWCFTDLVIILPYKFCTMECPRITVVGAFGFQDVNFRQLLGTGHNYYLEAFLQSD